MTSQLNGWPSLFCVSFLIDCVLSMWGKIIILMYRLWLHGLYGLHGHRCPLYPQRLLNLITHSLEVTCKSHPIVFSCDQAALWMIQSVFLSLSVRPPVQQSYLLCRELLPDRNRKSMGLWYWELMSRPDPAVLPVGTLHSLEWFWVSRRIFIYSHHNTFVFFSKTSVRAWFVC